MQCTYLSEFLECRNKALEMVFIPTLSFDKKKISTFQIMYEAKVIITSDEITPWKLFLMMREVEKEHPHLSGLSEKIVIMLEKEDF
jgi:hypothetical protein